MADGYIYCFSNTSMPGILKVGMTERTPEARLSEANASDTWRPPTPYMIEFAKKVTNPSQKEKALHILLEQYTDRIHPRREFFRVSPEEVCKFFGLMDGEMWEETHEEEEEEGEDTSPELVPCTTNAVTNESTVVRRIAATEKFVIGEKANFKNSRFSSIRKAHHVIRILEIVRDGGGLTKQEILDVIEDEEEEYCGGSTQSWKQIASVWIRDLRNLGEIVVK